MDLTSQKLLPAIPVCQDVIIGHIVTSDLENSSSIVTLNGEFLIIAKFNEINVKILRMNLSTLQLAGPELNINIKAEHLKLYHYGENILILSFSPTPFLGILDQETWKIEIYSIKTNGTIIGAHINEINEELLLVTKADALGIQSICINTKISTFHNLQTTYHISTIFATFQYDETLIIYTKEKPFLLYVDIKHWEVYDEFENQDKFQNEISRMKEALFFGIDQSEVPTFILFHDFPFNPYSALPLFQPFALSVMDKTIYIIKCSLYNVLPIYNIFTDLTNVYYINEDNDNFSLSTVFFYPIKQINSPEIMTFSSSSLIVKIPPIPYSPFLQSVKFIVINQTQDSLKLYKLNCVKIPSLLEIRISGSTKYKMFIRIDNGCGTTDSEPLYFETQPVTVPSECTNFKVDKLGDCEYEFSWSLPAENGGSDIDSFIIEGINFDGDVLHLFNIPGDTTIGAKAKIIDKFKKFVIYAVNSAGKGTPSMAIPKKRNMNPDVRFIWTIQQIDELKKMFELNSKPSKLEKMEIAEKLNAPLKSVSYWFQNHRAKSKKKVTPL
ncbi:LIM homeobox transcription factor 1-alpha [Histomonas meleagridis]|uniref:LIM homeobox transcription factor 1-alpha n=1 Tax=Histomonas meleagridis TaxID=135588 RepID=UPI0035598650|nr:LIM homeobox transcription factor 1-alpha [Histomonas meleagridis]KAH0800210.1 LIM homeobox transcription factor 1-alpha [Histomonas meleagridis]